MRIQRSRRSRRQQKNLLDISMTPLIDVTLTLLIIFILATPVLQNAIKVTLPRGNTQEDSLSSSKDLIVSIDKNNDFYINKEKIAKIDLIPSLKKLTGNDIDKIVYVKADSALSYGTIIELVDDIKCIGGIKHVALAIQKHSQKTSSLG